MLESVTVGWRKMESQPPQWLTTNMMKGPPTHSSISLSWNSETNSSQQAYYSKTWQLTILCNSLVSKSSYANGRILSRPTSCLESSVSSKRCKMLCTITCRICWKEVKQWMNLWRKVMTLTKPQSASIRKPRRLIVNAAMFDMNNDKITETFSLQLFFIHEFLKWTFRKY